MATDFLLPSSGSAAASPTVDTDWEGSSSTFYRAPMSTTDTNTALTDFASAVTTGTHQDVFAQFVSDTLDVNQTITGTCSIVVRGLEGTTNDDIHLAFVARVMSGDGSVERGVLCTQLATATEYGTTAATRIFSGLSVTSVNALAGDRIVLEVGIHGLTPAVGASATLRFGDPNGVANFAFTSGLTTDLRPVFRLSQTLTFGTPPSGGTARSQVIFF